MNSILYIGKDYCRTLEQLQGYFRQISSDQDALYNELLTLQRDGLIAQWLEEGTEKEKTLAKQINHLPAELTNKELMEKMAEILTNRNTSYDINLSSYLELKDVSYALHDSLSTEPIFKKISNGEVLNIKEEDLKGTLQLQMAFKIIKPEKETFRLNALLSLQQKTTHKVETDLCLNNEPVGKEKVIRWNIPTHLLKKEDDSYKLEVKSGGQLLFYAKLSLSIPEVFTVNGVEFKMIKVDGGSFQMGASANDRDALRTEGPRHKVTLSEYYIGETVVTQALWQAVMNNNPSNFKGDELPVENVCYNDINPFLDKLNVHLSVQLQGRKFALPTEEEWEFAARGGTKSKGFKYSGSNDLNEVAWYENNSVARTHPVKTKRPNELGIYDMSGNVWEWCKNFWRLHYNAFPNISKRMIRGGCYRSVAQCCRVAYRSNYAPDCRFSNLGFRLVLQ